MLELLYFIGCHSHLVEIQNYLQDGWQTIGIANVLFNLSIKNGFIGYIKLIDSDAVTSDGTNDDGYLSSIIPYCNIGDVYTRCKTFHIHTTGNWDDSMMEQLKSLFVEITKEEYESLITYKP